VKVSFLDFWGGFPKNDNFFVSCLKNITNDIKVVEPKKADLIFRDINIEQNGFHLLNKLAYWALRIGGFVAWNKHRKVNAKIV